MRCTFLESVLFNIPGLPKVRLRPRLLLESRWRRLARLCFALPVLVNANRLAALLLVLIFGMALS